MIPEQYAGDADYESYIDEHPDVGHDAGSVCPLLEEQNVDRTDHCHQPAQAHDKIILGRVLLSFKFKLFIIAKCYLSQTFRLNV